MDVSKCPGGYVRGRYVAIGRDGGEGCVHEGSDGAILANFLAGLILKRFMAGAFLRATPMGQQKVVMNQFPRFGDDGWRHWHFPIEETRIFCTKPES